MRRNISRGPRAMRGMGWLLVVLVFAFPCPASGDWAEFRREGMLLRHRASDAALAGVLLQELIAGRREVARKLGVPEQGEMTVYLASSEAEFHRLTQGRIPDWGVGCAFPGEGVIVLRKLPGRVDELMRVARHEISHVLLHRAAGGRVPVWFDEGVAMWAAQEWRLGQSMEVFFAVVSGGLVPLAEIDDVLTFGSPKAQLAYTESLLAVLYLIDLGGPDAVARMVSDLSDGVAFDTALFGVTAHTPGRFERTWAGYVRGRFSLVAVLVGPEAIWVYAMLLCVAAFVGLRIRNRRILRQWENEDPMEALPLRLRLQVYRREEEP